MKVSDQVTLRSSVTRTGLVAVGLEWASVNLSRINVYYRYEGMPPKSLNTPSCSLAVVEMPNFIEIFTLLYKL